MSNRQYTVLVTGTGGNVGQGIVRNIRSCYPDLRIVSTDIGNFTSAHHFSDAFHQVPYSHDNSFKNRIIDICTEENVDLILPATDYEAYYLSLFQEFLPPVVGSPPEVTKMCLDKLETFHDFKKVDLPFAESALPGDYQGEWDQIIVKPREGRGSRDLHINPPGLERFDDSFMVQRLLVGEEITTAFYVTKKEEILGPITFRRMLSSGMTERCEVTLEFDDDLKSLITRMTEAFPFRGPVNVQSMVEKGNSIVPFEINCRYSGTNSVRSQFGFEDVKYGIQEYLFGEEPDQPQIKSGSAIRLYMDIIYPGKKWDEILPGDKESHLF